MSWFRSGLEVVPFQRFWTAEILRLILIDCETTRSKGRDHFALRVKVWRKSCFIANVGKVRDKEVDVRDLSEIKITQRDGDVLKLLVQGCSNKEIASQLKISPRTVKQHLRTMFLRAGIRDGRKRVKLATAMYHKQEMELCNRAIN